MPLLLALLFLGCSFDTPTHDVDVREWSRAERVVLYSPHFDLLPEPYGGVYNCPSQPLRLYGFETPLRHPAATLLVRVYGPSVPTAGEAPTREAPTREAPTRYHDVPVRLSRRWLDGRFTELPETSPWMVDTDSAGAAILRVPAGVYEMEVRGGAPLGRGIIQVRIGAHDSLQVHLYPGGAC